MELITKLGFAALALFAAPLMAQDDAGMADEAEPAKVEEAPQAKLDNEERIRQLEERQADYERRLSGEDSHFTDDTGDVRWGGSRPGWDFSTGTDKRPSAFDVKFGGYFSMAYRGQFGASRNKSTTFDQHRFVPQLSLRIHDFVTFASEIEIEGGGADAGFLTDNEILVEYAELTFDIMPEFKPKAGLLLIPFGRYNLVHDDPLHDLFDRPFVSRRVVPSAFDQPGIGATGDFSYEAFAFHYDVAFTQGFSDNFTSNDGSRGSRQSFREDENSNKALWLRVAVTPDLEQLAQIADLNVSFGLSLSEQTVGADDYGTSGFGIDWQARWSPQDILEGRMAVAVEGEYDAIGIDRTDSLGVNDLDGWYFQASLQYRPWDDNEWKGWLRDSGYVALTLRLEGNDLDDRQVGGGVRDDREAVTFGLAFRPYFKTVIRAEWKSINSSGVNGDDPDRFVFSLSTYF